MPSSTGTCRLCNKSFSGSTITRHLESCLKSNPLKSSAKPIPTLHIRATGAGMAQYWLHILAPPL